MSWKRKTGTWKSPTYRAWIGMKTRCYNQNNKQFKDYGGRGIKVCDRWRGSFDNFLEDMGERPDDSLSLDRIDNDGNYEPGNCRWTTRHEQQLNRRPAFYIEPRIELAIQINSLPIRSKDKIALWHDRTGMNYSTYYRWLRLSKSMSA